MVHPHVVWFKRDLRLHDHQPLAAAARQGPVIPLYVFEPEYWQQPDTSGRQWRFVRACLRELDAELRAAYGQGLLIRSGSVVTILAELHRRHPLAGLWSHEETGNGWTFARDRAVAAWARQAGVPWHEFRQDGVIRRLASRTGWAEHWDRFMSAPITPRPEQVHILPVQAMPGEPGPMPPPLEDACPLAQRGGRSQALALLDSFLSERGRNYARDMSAPGRAEHSCSRLSPHLAWGTISMREVVQKTRQRKETAAPGWGRALSAFEARLAWQSHFMQKLESEPRLEFDNLHPALAEQRQTVDVPLFQAWSTGHTGLPMVDACMRMLHATGWLNFRMRAMLAAFACYHLWQPWRAAGLHLARLFVDYEPGIHWSQMQMQSGSTGINAFRIYNPVKQSLDHDPDGHFIRRWVPELAAVPREWIHEPWRMPLALQQRYGCRIGRDYPPPCVDHEQAARLARERLYAAYRTPDARQASAQVLAKHGSRKRRPRPQVTQRGRQIGLFE